MNDNTDKNVKKQKVVAKRRNCEVSEHESERQTVAAKHLKVSKTNKKETDNFKGARRKIEFGDKQVNKNNCRKSLENENKNANRLVKKTIHTRSKSSDPIKNVGQNTTMSTKVQWTKEFMKNIRQSNKKNLENKKSKTGDKKIETVVSNDKHVGKNFQKGDGIVTEVENANKDDVDNEEDLLDYEDDISIEEMDPDQVIEKECEEECREKPQPGTSKQCSQIEKDTRDLMAHLAKQPEAVRSNNPFMMMMEDFFEKKFKDMEAQAHQSHVNVKQAAGNQKSLNGNTMNRQNVNKDIKSPSDTTIYAPALQKKLTPQAKLTQDELMDSYLIQSCEPTIENENEMMISNFVGNVRRQQHPEDTERVDMDTMRDLSRMRSEAAAANLKEAQIRAERGMQEAEKFQANVETPGMVDVFNLPKNLDQGIEQNRESLRILNIGSGVSDDDFFHLTCHIDPNLIHKIEKGEFVELEKLLPKDKIGKAEENRLEWVQRDGGTFLVPAQRDNKIGSFRRWEQAFRAYATIYCGANPRRSKEIWQYITVINTAASSFSWDNVYNYDITFRHLMAFNPHRSWAVTYNQMWNLSMRDPLPKQQFNRNGGQSHYSGAGYVPNEKKGGGTGKRPKSDYCWDFNKGEPCKYGKRCRYIERCSYCDSPTHGVLTCYKLMKKEERKANHGNHHPTAGGNKNNSNNHKDKSK